MQQYDKSLIFSQAHARCKKTGETFATALKGVWGFYRKNVFAARTTDSIITDYEALNSAKEISEYVQAKTKVDRIVTALKATYKALIEVQIPAAIVTANIIASVVNKRGETPSNRQMWAIVCGAWENGIILNL